MITKNLVYKALLSLLRNVLQIEIYVFSRLLAVSVDSIVDNSWFTIIKLYCTTA